MPRICRTLNPKPQDPKPSALNTEPPTVRHQLESAHLHAEDAEDEEDEEEQDHNVACTHQCRAMSPSASTSSRFGI